jgi:hypothetical protein
MQQTGEGEQQTGKGEQQTLENDLLVQHYSESIKDSRKQSADPWYV